jgi:preprotein translocase subunit SecF
MIGSGEIKDLSLYLVAGIILGAYSTMFVVCPIVVWWEDRKAKG